MEIAGTTEKKETAPGFLEMTAIVVEKSHLFGMIRWVEKVVFDTKGHYTHPTEARETAANDWEIRQSEKGMTFWVCSSNKHSSTVVIYCSSGVATGHSGNFIVLKVMHKSDKSYTVRFRSDIFDCDAAMFIVTKLLRNYALN